MHSDGVLPYFNDGIYAVTELDLDDAYAIVKVDFEKAAFESLTPQIEDNFIFDARIYCHLINEVTKEVE